LSRKNVAIFLPIQSKKEPNTFLLMSEFLVENLKYFAPKIDLSLNKMNFYSIENENQIEYGPYQIPEPKSHYKIELNELDFILIPLLCFDSRGNRVGYGKGYYDRFLENAPQKLVKIGITLFDQFEIIDDVDINDIPLDFCITPNNLIRFVGEK
jgi:5-formyltetrahydrofolate cyclo-ligase